MHNRRGFALIVAILIVAALLINVAVAWVCAVAAGPRAFKENLSDPQSGQWIHIGALKDAPSRPPWAVHWSGFGVDADWVHSEEASLIDQRALRVGWPCRALCGVLTRQSTWDNKTSEETRVGDWGVSWPRTESPEYEWYAIDFLPCRPLILGFAANTSLYAAVLVLLFRGPGAMRRCHRRRRGCCIECGYSAIGNSTGVCSECGMKMS